MALLPRHEDSFFWNGKLSAERKQQIITFLQQLPPEQQDLIKDLLDDQRAETKWECSDPD